MEPLNSSLPFWTRRQAAEWCPLGGRTDCEPLFSGDELHWGEPPDMIISAGHNVAAAKVEEELHALRRR